MQLQVNNDRTLPKRLILTLFSLIAGCFLLLIGSSASADNYRAMSNNGSGEYYLSNSKQGSSNHAYTMSDIYASYIFTKAHNTGDSASVAYNTIAEYPADAEHDKAQTYGILNDPPANASNATAGYQFATAAKTLYGYHYLNTVYTPNNIFGYIGYLFKNGTKSTLLGQQLSGALMGARMYNAGSAIVEKLSEGVNSINIPYIVTSAIHQSGDNSAAMNKLKSETNTKGGTGLFASMYESILSIFQISGTTFKNISILLWIGIALWFIIALMIDLTNPYSGRSKIWTRVKRMAFRIITICLTLQLTVILTGVINDMNKKVANGIAGPEAVSSGYVVNTLKYAATTNFALGPINPSATLPQKADSAPTADKDFAPTVERVTALNGKINALYGAMANDGDSANLAGTDQSTKSAESATKMLQSIKDQDTVGVNDYFAAIADANHNAPIAAAYTVDGGNGHLGNAWSKQTQPSKSGSSGAYTLQDTFTINNSTAAFLNSSSYSAGDNQANGGGDSGDSGDSGSGNSGSSAGAGTVDQTNVSDEDLASGNVYVTTLGASGNGVTAKFLFGAAARFVASPVKWYDPSTYVFGYVPAGGMSDEERYTANYFDGQGDYNHQNYNPSTGQSFDSGSSDSSSSKKKDKDSDSDSDKDKKDDKDSKDSKDSKDKAVFNQKATVASTANAENVAATTDRPTWRFQNRTYDVFSKPTKKTHEKSSGNKGSKGSKGAKATAKAAQKKNKDANSSGDKAQKALNNDKNQDKQQVAMQYNAATIALNNRYNGIANMGGAVPSFSTQSTAFLIQSYEKGAGLEYKGDNTAPNTAGQSANTGSESVKFAKYTIPYSSKSDFMVKLSGLTNVWMIAGITMLVTIIYLFRAPIFSGYWKMTTNYFSAQFLGNFGGFLNYLVYYAATLLTFSFARVATLIMSQLYSGLSTAIAHVQGFNQLTKAHAITAAAGKLLTGGATGYIPSVFVIVFGLLAVMPLFSAQVGNKQKKVSVVGAIVLLPYMIAELLAEDINYLQQRVYGRSGRDGLISRLTGQKVQMHPEYAAQSAGKVVKGAAELGMAVGTGGTSLAGKAIGAGKAVAGMFGNKATPEGDSPVDRARNSVINALGLERDADTGKVGINPDKGVIGATRHPLRTLDSIGDQAANYTGVNARDELDGIKAGNEAQHAADAASVAQDTDPAILPDNQPETDHPTPKVDPAMSQLHDQIGNHEATIDDPFGRLQGISAENAAKQTVDQAKVRTMFNKDGKLINADTGKEITEAQLKKAYPNGVPADAIHMAPTAAGNAVATQVTNADEIGRSIARNSTNAAANAANQSAAADKLVANGSTINPTGDVKDLAKEIKLPSSFDPNLRTANGRTAAADAAVVKHANEVIGQSSANVAKHLNTLNSRVASTSNFADKKFIASAQAAGLSNDKIKAQLPSQQLADSLKKSLSNGLSVDGKSITLPASQLKSLNLGNASSVIDAVSKANPTVDQGKIAQAISHQIANTPIKTTVGANAAPTSFAKLNSQQISSMANNIIRHGNSVQDTQTAGAISTLGNKIATNMNALQSAQKAGANANASIVQAIQKQTTGYNPGHPNLERVSVDTKNISRAVKTAANNVANSHLGKAARYGHDVFFSNEGSKDWIGSNGGSAPSTPTGGKEMREIEEQLRKMRQTTHDDLRDLGNRR